MAKLSKKNYGMNVNQINLKGKEEAKEDTKKLLFVCLEYGLIVLFAVGILYVALHHECFEDETQSWLLARDLNPIELFMQMRYEGHSVLWFYMIMPFAKLGFPILSQVLISCAFAIGTAILVFRKSPFPLWLKFLTVFSGGMIFMFSVNARPYCMIPFFFALLAYMDDKKEKHPYIYALCIGMLANTHMIMLPSAFLIGLYFWGDVLLIKRKEKHVLEQKQYWFSGLVAVFGIALMTGLAAWGYFYCKIIDNYDNQSAIVKLSDFVKLFMENCKATVSFYIGLMDVSKIVGILFVLLVLLCLIGAIGDVKQGVAFWAQLIFTMLIHTLTWFILAPRVYVFTFTLMYWLWIGFRKLKEKDSLRKVCFGMVVFSYTVFVLISAPGMYRLAYDDVKGYYSTGKVMAEYIRDNVPKGTVILCLDAELHQSVAAYLKKDDYYFYMPNQEKCVTFITWDEDWQEGISVEQISKGLDYCKNNYDSVYVLSQQNAMINDSEIVYHTVKKLTDNPYARQEKYILYKVNN